LGSLKLNGQMTFASEVSILDIGMGGVSVTADQRLNIGGKYRLKLEGDQKVFSVTCQVAWAKMSGTRKSAAGETVPIYTAGMKFVGLPPEAASDLRSFVDTIGEDQAVPENDRREHQRFVPRTPGLALLDFPAEYKVRTISLSGMLIETAASLESERRIPMVLYLRDGGRIDFLGRIVSCLPAVEEGVEGNHIGIEFVDLPDTGREALSAFVLSLSAIYGEDMTA
jgi:Tfp pilus assembly protein PilZ